MTVTQEQLTSCDREPIHIPGSIQPHGFLLVLHPETLAVYAASENSTEYLGLSHAAILDRGLADLFDAEIASRLHEVFSRMEASLQAKLIAQTTLNGAEQVAGEFDIIAHRTDSAVIVEFERSAQQFAQQALDADLYNILAKIQSLESAQQICELAVREIRRITGFDRVLMYRFDEDGHGTTIAEVTNERLPSYLDLRFPASDIPVQARRLYALNRVRIIPNVDYTPSLLISNSAEATAIDLSGSVLRSVSPVHRDYMRNMGTISSMSVSIVINNELWGLISCHHAEPLAVPFRLRSASDFLVQIFSTQLAAQLRASQLSKAISLKSVQHRLLTHMAAEDNFVDGLVRYPEDLLGLAGASGAAVVVGDDCQYVGATPSAEEVLQLSAFLQQRKVDEVFSTQSLESIFPPAANWTTNASGVLAISISKLHRVQVLWFRAELVKTVKWAGDPLKPMDTTAENQIQPRHSFADWSEIVRGRSAPWLQQEIEAAGELRTAILEVVLKQAEELAELAGNLRSANEELEAFSYSVSHDLRAPFRHIVGFSELLLEQEGPNLSERGQRYARTIIESARFAGQLVDSLLNFSRIARSGMSMQPVDLRALFEDQWRDLISVEASGRTIAFQLGELPIVYGDYNLLRQVVRNLLSNAAKYTQKKERPTVVVNSERKQFEHVICVADNGAGFDQAYEGKLFGVFQRLHRAEEFEGTGIGLANVRRIVSRHGGRTWAEGQVGVGAKFYFSLPMKLAAIERPSKSTL